MPTTLIVLAHPDTRSFTGAWAEATRRALLDQGHRVLTSSLNDMAFDPVERAGHYVAWPDLPFDVLKAQEQASASDQLPADVTSEIAKLEAADRVVFHFPLWWFAPPAILKGWFERVLVHGRTHTTKARFDTGKFRGRKALFCVSTGASEGESGPDGKEGETRLHLWPAAYALRYLGFDVLEPLTVHGVHGYHEGPGKRDLEGRLADVLKRQAEVMRRFDTLPLMRFNADTEFDARGRLKRGAPSHTPFIRHASVDRKT